MKKFEGPKKRHRFTAALSILLLAAICIGGVELLVCSYQEPELYAAITAPARAAAHRLGEAGVRAWNGLTAAGGQLWDGMCAAAEGAAVRLQEYFTPPPEPEEPDDTVQLVDETAVETPPRPRADLAVTSLTRLEGVEYLTGGARDVVYYSQTAEEWASQPYGSDQIGGYGCGPTAMAMVVSTLTDRPMDPAQMAQYCVDQGYWAKKHGSYRSIVQGVSAEFGLECTPLPPEEADLNTVTRYLATGQLMVALMGPGHFTSRGHFIVLRGITLDGSILVADPASPERSTTTWELELIVDELSSSRDSGSPLWIISAGTY